MFDSTHEITIEQKVQELRNDIRRFTKACKSDWPTPSDYTNLIDAQYAFQELKQSNVMTMPKNLVFERTSNLAFLKNQLLALSMKPKNPQNTLRT